MSIVQFDIAQAVSELREYVLVEMPFNNPLGFNNAIAFNQNVIGLAISPDSDVAQASLNVAFDGTDAFRTILTPGSPVFGIDGGVMGKSSNSLVLPASLRETFVVMPNPLNIPPSTLVNYKGQDDPVLRLLAYIVPPKSVPLQRKDDCGGNGGIAVAAGTSDLFIAPTYDRHLWHMAFDFPTPANITAVNLYGRWYRTLGGGETLLATGAPNAQGVVEFVITNRPAFHACRVEVVAVGLGSTAEWTFCFSDRV